MTHEELNAIVDGMWKPIREQIQAANQRIAELEARIAAMPAPIQPAPIDVEAIADRAAALIKPPKDGQDAPPVDVDSIVLRVAELIPAPKDGKDVDMEAVRQMIVAAVSEAVISLPIPKDGKDGRDGIDGRDAQPLDGELFITEVLKRLPIPKDGRDGANGKDAVLPDIAAMIDSGIKLRFADWAVDQERQAQEVFRRAIEAMPKPKDGKDAFELEDLVVTDDGHGNVTLTFIRGELTRTFTVRIPGFEYFGVWREGAFKRGNYVTWAGSLWHCNSDTQQKPGAKSSDWQLAVKRGEDGQVGLNGKDGERGPQGPPGRDLTQMDFDGRKY